MTHRSMLFALGFVPLVGIACAARATQLERAGALTTQDVAALRRIAERDAPLVRAGDWASLAAGYERDAVRMPPNGPAVRGRDAIRRMLEQLPPVSAFDFRLVDLQGNGNLAYMRGAWSITVVPPGATSAVSDSGKILVVFRKQLDGSWLRVADAWNSDLPAPR